MSYYCNHCDSTFQFDGEGDVVCPLCGVGVTTKNPILTHPVNKPLSMDDARLVIKYLGWGGFKAAQPLMAEMHPELRPISRKLATKQKEKDNETNKKQIY